MGEEGDVDAEEAVGGRVVADLAHRLEEGLALDIAHGAAHLADDHLGVVGLGGGVDAGLDLVREVGDGLDGAAEVVPVPFALEHGAVDLPAGDGAGGAQVLIEKALIVAEVEVGFGAVRGHEHLAVLVGRHRAGVDVEVGVELLDGDGESAGFEQSPDAGGGNAFAHAADDAAGDEDEPGHAAPADRMRSVDATGGGGGPSTKPRFHPCRRPLFRCRCGRP